VKYVYVYLVAPEGFSCKSEAHAASALLGKEMFKLQRESEELETGSCGQPSETVSFCTQRCLSSDEQLHGTITGTEMEFSKGSSSFVRQLQSANRSSRSFSQSSATQTLSSGIYSKIPTAFRLWLTTKKKY